MRIDQQKKRIFFCYEQLNIDSVAKKPVKCNFCFFIFRLNINLVINVKQNICSCSVGVTQQLPDIQLPTIFSVSFYFYIIFSIAPTECV